MDTNVHKQTKMINKPKIYKELNIKIVVLQRRTRAFA